MSTAERRKAARSLISRGVTVIPVPKGEKNPGRRGWEELRISEDEVDSYWTNGQNIGLLTGEPSGGLVDVDLDSDEAVKLAGRFLPPTLTSGRTERPHSHWWYRCVGIESRDYKDTNGSKLVELRSTGRQTIVAPSIHPSGDEYVWHRESGLSVEGMGQEDLTECLQELASASLAARHLSKHRKHGGGGRHDYALALSGFLLRRLDSETVLKILRGAWSIADFPGESEKREALKSLDGVVSDTARKLQAGENVVGGPTLDGMCPRMVKQLSNYWSWERRVDVEQSDGEEEKQPTQAERLIRCAEDAQLFHTPSGESYATIPAGSHSETHPVKSRGFRQFLVRAFYEECGRPPGAQAMQDALGLLEARAQFDGPEYEVHVRVAQSGSNIYLDLANEAWEVVEVTPGGWRVMSSSDAPVRFRRPRGMLPLPAPADDLTVRTDDVAIEDRQRKRRRFAGASQGTDDADGLLRPFINVLGGEGLKLIIAWLIAALRPRGPYPVLILQGEQGSAKSTTERLLKTLVDPSTAPLRTTPRNEHDLYIAADSSHVVALDNISTLQPWLSDALCRLSTGGGFSTRTLYENREQELFEGTRPIILNGIADIATRPDLVDRALLVTLPRIPEDKRQSEAELWEAFERGCPALLGKLLEGVSGALSRISSLRLEGLPRMADFALWATAAEDALGWEQNTFMAAYSGNRAEATESALDADPVATSVRSFMENRNEWSGSVSELWEKLGEDAGDEIRRTKAWPKAPNALSGKLTRLAPALRDVGIEYERASDGKRTKTLKKTSAKDRQNRKDRQPPEKTLQNSALPTDDLADDDSTTDDPAFKDRQAESPANEHVADDDYGTDDDSQRLSNPLTTTQKREVEKLTHCGMSEEMARAEVLGEEIEL